MSEDPFRDLLLAQALLSASSVAGELGAEHRLAEAVLTAEQAVALDTTALHLLGTGIGRWMLGHNDEAARLARRALDRARQDSALALVPQALRLLASAELDRGRWRAAYAAASEAAELASEVDQQTTACACLGLLAEVDAATGAHEECGAHAARAIAIARATGLGYYRERAERALGRLELVEGRVVEAIERLEEVQQRLEHAGNWEVNVTPAWDLVEAYARAGELEKAGALLSRAEEAMPPVSAAEEAAIQRCHGIVAGESFEGAFERALELHDAEPFPFEQARTRLAYGERLRRAGERRRARDQLRAALGVFDELGAVAWSARARAELAAAGERLRPAEVARESLTPRELQVALAVAEGASNAEVAASLYP